MKFISCQFLLLFSIITLLSSCLSSTDTTTVSAVPTFVSLKFGANDSIPNLSTAVFTLVEINAATKDSIIVNLDSLPYNTRIDSVFPTFSFKSTSGAYLITANDTTALTGKDTVDFRVPVTILNYASDRVNKKQYKIKVNVHQVKAELYVWSKVFNEIDSHNASSQKAIVYNDTMFYYLNNASFAYLYKSIDGKSWSSVALSNFPIGSSITDMQLFNAKLFVTKNGQILSTSNRRTWTSYADANFTFKSLLFSLNSKLWAVVQLKTDLSYRFASSTDGQTWINEAPLKANFPISDFAALSFNSRVGKQKALVIGGLSTTNERLKNSWSTENGTTWVDFSAENHSLDTLAAGASLLNYDNKLFVLGLRNGGTVTHFKQSLDEGYSWQEPDTAYNKMALLYDPRNYQSVLLLKPKVYTKLDTKEMLSASNWIYIIGGISNGMVKTDVWSGKLNRKNFLRQ